MKGRYLLYNQFYVDGDRNLDYDHDEVHKLDRRLALGEAEEFRPNKYSMMKSDWHPGAPRSSLPK